MGSLQTRFDVIVILHFALLPMRFAANSSSTAQQLQQRGSTRGSASKHKKSSNPTYNHTAQDQHMRRTTSKNMSEAKTSRQRKRCHFTTYVCTYQVNILLEHLPPQCRQGLRQQLCIGRAEEGASSICYQASNASGFQSFVADIQYSVSINHLTRPLRINAAACTSIPQYAAVN